MADSRLTIQKFIDRFKPATPTDITSISKIDQLDEIHLNKDFFIKEMDDKDFIPSLLPKIEGEFHSKKLQFFTWVEIEGKAEYSDSSFWLFPVIFYKDNNLAEMIESVKSLIKFRKEVTGLYNIEQSDKIDEIIKVGIVGKYYKAFDEVASTADQKALSIMRRQAQIIKDNIEDEFRDGLKVYLVNHQYENQLKNWLFCESDIKKTEAFAEKLKGDTPVFTYIKNKLSEKAKELINDRSQIEMFIEILIADLNSMILKDTEFYDKKRFEDIKLEEETKKAIRNGHDIIRRNRLLMEDAFKDEIEKYRQIDIIIFPNGFMGNILYRAWVSVGYLKRHVSMVYHHETLLPIYLGKSIYAPENDFENKFASACKGLKNLMIRCALITTNQVDGGIRALSGLIQGAKLPKSIMLNLSTGTNTYPEEYPEDVRDQILKAVKANGCNFLCFSIVDLFFNRTIELIKYLKEKTGLPIIVGGIHAELYPEETIGVEGVDAVCTGEAYQSFVTVLSKWGERFKKDIPDFWFKKEDGSVKKNMLTPFYHGDDFKNNPLPDYSYANYHLLDGNTLRDISSTPVAGPFKVEQHQIGHNGSVIFNSMGGCSNKCSFCNLTAQVKMREVSETKVRQFRQKPLSLVKAELEAITKYNANMKFLCVMENDFTCRKEKDLKKYCEYISSICKVPYYTMVSPNTLSEEKLRFMVKNGLKELNMGIQTNENFNAFYYARKITDSHILKTVKMVNKYTDKIHPFFDFINFNPEEPDDSILETIYLVKQFPLPYDFVIHHLTLGQELLLYKRLVREKKVPGEEVEKTNLSDYHNLNFDDYKNWETLYLNLFLEWIAGQHNDEWAGRLPRDIETLKTTDFGKRLFENDKIKDIKIKPHTDIFTLFTAGALFDILNVPENRRLLEELNNLLPEVRYTNQQ